jgi:hypothetical protein
VRGDNFFFAPQGPRASDIVNMEQVNATIQALGAANGSMHAMREEGTPNDGYRLYSRRYRNGIVYLNLTGKRKTISLPTDRTYYNRSGQRVREITLDDLRGDYVLTRPSQG